MSKCKYYKQKKQVSWDSGQTWSDVSPAQYQVGNLYEMDSLDCTDGEIITNWIVVPGDFFCDGKNKYEKEIAKYSTDGGNTWKFFYPSVYRFGRLIETNSSICNNKWEGYYYTDDDLCGDGAVYVEGVGCVRIIVPSGHGGTINGWDPVKYIRCSSSTTITDTDVAYSPYILYEGIIGDCVNSIGVGAFQGCTSLSSITIPNSVTSIGNNAFQGCTSLSSITIPDSVTSIGSNAFKDCRSLTGITIPSGVTSISDSTFWECRSLTGITIPDNITSIEEWAFYGCSDITDIIIPDSVTTIGGSVFRDCISLTSCTIGSGVTSIDYWAFMNCSGLTGITINATTPPTIHQQTFIYTNCPIYVPCESLATYKREWNVVYDRIYPIPPCETPPVPTNYKLYETYSGGTYHLIDCNSGTTLTSGETGSYLDSRDKIVDAMIGNCVTTIGVHAFSECANLSSVTISSSVTSIGNSAFYYCYSLSSVDIPSGVTSIGNYAFMRCSITSCTIGSGVTSIGEGAFSYCTNLNSITCLASVPPTLGGTDVFAYSDNCIVYVPCDSVIAYRAADRWKSIKSRIQGIPPCTVPLKLNATYSNSTVYELDCNDSSTLTEGEVTSFTTSRTAMTSAIIGDCVTTIGNYAFANCYVLSSVTIPNSVTSINYDAFADCSGLTNVTIPDSVTSIGSSAFFDCYSLTSCTIGSGVTTIGRSAFENCSGITSINIPGSVESLGADAFESCYGITSIDIPDSVKTIGTGMCQYCRSLTSVTIGSGITSIGSYAFASCSNLASFTITKVTPPILENDRQYGGHPHTFDNVNNLVIYVPSQSVQTYKTASGWSEYASRIQAIP